MVKKQTQELGDMAVARICQLEYERRGCCVETARGRWTLSSWLSNDLYRVEDRGKNEEKAFH